ncbi:MAG: pilin [Elusimicrobiaceae bacterium]|nr:pilin [Elusimicrobiaceae bacterium]
MSKKAFTLIELLIVVLIIGVLSAIAIPMYQGAVDKSHWSTMLPGAKAIKDAEEAIKMTNGAYTDNMANLDVTMNNADLTFALVTPNNTADPNVIRVTNSKLPNVRLASYLDDNPKFAGQLHCEALAGDERANRLCEKLLLGQYLKNTDDGYTRYLLDQSVDKATCGAATGSWSSSKTKCYKDDQTRCDALNMDYLGNGQCGFENVGTNKIVGEEGVAVCNAIDSCRSATFDGGFCIANAGYSCRASTFKNGAICYANAGAFACGSFDPFNTDVRSTYDDTSCCCGNNCPSYAPSCASRGITCDPQYMK